MKKLSPYVLALCFCSFCPSQAAEIGLLEPKESIQNSACCDNRNDPEDPDGTKSTPKDSVYMRPLPPLCIGFSSKSGKELLKQSILSGHDACFYSLMAQFHTQSEPAFCGLGTLVTVLNALHIDPSKVWKGIWRWYSEEMLACCKSIDEIAETGITLEQFTCIARCNGANVQQFHAENTNIEHFRSLVKKITRDGDSRYLISSYTRKLLNQTGDGHFSPLAAYEPSKDMVLILDVARFKYPPHWVPLKVLWEAMLPKDADTGKSRGYFVIGTQEDGEESQKKPEANLPVSIKKRVENYANKL